LSGQCLVPIVAAKSRSYSLHPICWCTRLYRLYVCCY